MSSELSARAHYQILGFIKGTTYFSGTDDDELSQRLRMLRLDGSVQNGHRLLERRLTAQNALREKDVQDIFAHGKPLVFDEEDYPRLIVPTIVEAFQRLTNEPTFLDVTIAMPTKKYDCASPYWGPASRMDDPTVVWPRIYDVYLPCDVRTTVVRSSSWHSSKSWYATEAFHVSSKHFDKQLTVKLHFALEIHDKYGHDDAPVRPPTAPKEEKSRLRTVTMVLVDGVYKGSTSATAARRSKSILFIADFALEVYCYVDRAHLGCSLIANRGLNEQIFKLRHLLPVHHLMCEFEEIPICRDYKPQPPEEYWLVVHHFRRDLTYSDVRRFRVPSTAGHKSSAADCGLIVRYLSNSHVADFKAPTNEPRFSVKMLAALVDCNFSVGRLCVRFLNGPMTDYRSLDAIFGSGMRLGALKLYIHEDDLRRLIKTTDFFRMPAMQRLKELKLESVGKAFPSMRCQRAVLSSPLWTDGIRLLHNTALYRADCTVWSKRQLKSIALKVVHICEAFERGEVTETVANSVFRFSTRLAFPFKVGKQIASGVCVNENPWAFIASYTWDVYRFRNAATGDWLTACVAQTESRPRFESPETVLRIVKGEVYPDPSFSPYLEIPI